MAPPSSKLAVLLDVLQRRGRQERAAWESAQLALTNKHKEREQLQELQSDYGEQLENFAQGQASALADRLKVYGTLENMVQALAQELNNLERAERQCYSHFRQTLAKQRGIQRLLDTRKLAQQQLQRRQDRANS